MFASQSILFEFCICIYVFVPHASRVWKNLMSLLIISRYFSRVRTEQRNKLNREKRETFKQLYAKTLFWWDYPFTHGINNVTNCFIIFSFLKMHITRKQKMWKSGSSKFSNPSPLKNSHSSFLCPLLSELKNTKTLRTRRMYVCMSCSVHSRCHTMTAI